MLFLFPTAYDCLADNLGGDQLLEFLLGYDPSSSGDHVPSITNFLHFGPGRNYSCNSETDVEMSDGINSKAFSAHWEIVTPAMAVNVTYFWSNAKGWRSTAGQNVSVPIRAHIQGHMTLPGDQGFEDHEFDIIFGNFMEPVFSPQIFTGPVSYLSCNNRKRHDANERKVAAGVSIQLGGQILF